MAYITASIVVQLLTPVVPRLEKLKQESRAGTAKITQYTRYLTVGLAVLISATVLRRAHFSAEGDMGRLDQLPHGLIP
jgi:preprotein translocase subunit SecY